MPQPGPADRTTRGGARAPSSELISSPRDTIPLGCGGSSFDSSSSNGGTEDGAALTPLGIAADLVLSPGGLGRTFGVGPTSPRRGELEARHGTQTVPNQGTR